ncbi:long-chain fatty acid--CoA ligase [Sulfurovum sp.]|uniref:AMP-dependent synthetase/ligase n=1 Tax=Sulfurovum sp. TaxID=1969726 RepID=UPI0025D97DD3|nr:AMP-dependent synthetase/ligase [Sulfurovum sp.]
MNSHFTHFGELYRYLENGPCKKAFLHHRSKEGYRNFSKEEFLLTVRYLALAFHQKGWKGKQIAIAITPSPYWLMLDYALMLSGAVSVPLFTNISSKNLHYQILDAAIHTAFIEDKEQEKVILGAGKGIETIYLLEHVPGQHTFSELVAQGKKIDEEKPSVFGTLVHQINPQDLATIVYTSGTSGIPKGVELTHKNLISQIHATALHYHFDKDEDVAFSFLPLAHIFERMVMHFYISQELSIYFADDVKNVGALLKEVNPTVMTVVPRLLEKVFFKMKLKAMEGNFIKKALASLAFHRATNKDPNVKTSLLDKILDKLIYKKLRMAMGNRMRMMISGGAALSDMLYRFYLNIGVPVYQGYGQTEASPVICANTPKNNKIGTCGKAFPGVRVKLNAEGELLAKGANVMRGYHHDEEATAEVIDAEGWLHTGDLADMDDEGYITITGRKRELLKTSTGEFVSSVYIEQKLVSNGWFEHALLIGDGRPFVTALLFVEPDFLGRLSTQMKNTPRKALNSDKFKMMTKKFIKTLNQELNHWEKIRQFRFIGDVLSIEKGELTPSMKLAKKQLMKRYSHEIEDMYKDHL